MQSSIVTYLLCYQLLLQTSDEKQDLIDTTLYTTGYEGISLDNKYY